MRQKGDFIMKGLLLKEFYVARKEAWSLLFLVAVFEAISLLAFEDNTFYVFYSIIVTSLIPISLLAYDEKCKWVVYGDIFPYSRNQLVSAKYLVTLFCTGSVFALSVAVQLARFLWFSERVSHTDPEYMFSMLLIVLGVSLLSSSILLPVTFKLGTEKGRFAFMGAIVFICAGSTFVSVDPQILLPISTNILAVLCLTVCIVIFLLSWKLSIKIYRKKEF